MCWRVFYTAVDEYNARLLIITMSDLHKSSLFANCPCIIGVCRYHWILGSLGPCQIVSIILRATGGLERRQADKYSSDKEFQAYTASTPVLIPGTRQYRWKEENSKA